MKREIVLRGSCQTDADMLYFTGVPVPDPFYAFTLRGRKCALIGALELGRLSKGGRLDEIFDLSSLSRKYFPNGRADETAVLAKILKNARVRGLLVPQNFPALQLERLRAAGFDVAVADAPILPERDVKSARELAEIEKANAVAAKGFARIAQILRESEVSDGKLVWRFRASFCASRSKARRWRRARTQCTRLSRAEIRRATRTKSGTARFSRIP